jgi:hypothetical protein
VKLYARFDYFEKRQLYYYRTLFRYQISPDVSLARRYRIKAMSCAPCLQNEGPVAASAQNEKIFNYSTARKKNAGVHFALLQSLT